MRCYEKGKWIDEIEMVKVNEKCKNIVEESTWKIMSYSKSVKNAAYKPNNCRSFLNYRHTQL